MWGMVTNNTCSTCLSHICIGWQNIQNWQDILTNGMIWGNQRKHGHYAPLCVKDTQHTPWVQVYQVLPHLLHTRATSCPMQPGRLFAPTVTNSWFASKTARWLRTKDMSHCQRCIPEMWVAVSIPEQNINFNWNMFGYPALMLGKYIGTDNPQKWTNCFVHAPAMYAVDKTGHPSALWSQPNPEARPWYRQG